MISLSLSLITIPLSWITIPLSFQDINYDIIIMKWNGK
jgi:hypothetical protein